MLICWVVAREAPTCQVAIRIQLAKGGCWLTTGAENCDGVMTVARGCSSAVGGPVCFVTWTGYDGVIAVAEWDIIDADVPKAVAANGVSQVVEV
jgi:hypothetical protein